DCSIKEYGQYFLAAQLRDPSDPNKNFHLPKARSECALDPNDPCCKSCGQDPGSCPPDPGCGAGDPVDDNLNLRCWDQKRRFGIDFLYPVDRYTQALTSPTVATKTGELVQNPLFAGIRDPGSVIVTGIVGVPWQDVAHDPKDLQSGLKRAQELADPDDQGHTT